MKVDVLDTKGKKVSQVELSDSLFRVVPNMTLISQYVRTYLLNQRQGTTSAKTRAEVSGSGKKPWKQKGTGRARHGSKRSPLWRHGGIVHGPKPKTWSLGLPKKMRRAALISALSLKASQNRITILDSLEFESPKTSDLNNILKNLAVKGKTLLVLPENNKVAVKSGSNLQKLKVSNVDILNVYEVVSNNSLVLLKDTLEKLESKYAN